ncbi:MAG: hypothetical protein ABIO72_01305 [Patescibacteria group bacterium]
MASLHSELTAGELVELLRALAQADITREDIRSINQDHSVATAMRVALDKQRDFAHAVKKLHGGVTVDYENNALDQFQALPKFLSRPDAKILDIASHLDHLRSGTRRVALVAVQIPSTVTRKGVMRLQDAVTFLEDQRLSPATLRDSIGLLRLQGLKLLYRQPFPGFHLVGSYGYSLRQRASSVHSLKIVMDVGCSLILVRGTKGETTQEDVDQERIEAMAEGIQILVTHGEYILAVRSIEPVS